MERLQTVTETLRANRLKGVNVGRFAQSLAYAKGNVDAALNFAEKNYRDTPRVAESLELARKAAVAAGTGTDASWAGPLVLPKPLADEFAALIVPHSILTRLPFRQVPPNVKIARVTSGTNSAWVSEGGAIPVQKLSLDSLTLGYAKTGTIVVITEELAKFASPLASALIANDLARSTALFCDENLLDPNVAAVAGVSPASVTHGANSVTSSGGTPAEVIADVLALMSLFTDNRIPLYDSTLVMSESVAISWSALVGSGGSPIFPDLRIGDGGSIFGVPVSTVAFPIPTTTTGAMTASGTESVALIYSDGIMFADLGITVDTSEEGAVMMDSAPPGSAQNLVSFFQAGLVGVRGIRYIDWVPRRANAVAVLSGIVV